MSAVPASSPVHASSPVRAFDAQVAARRRVGHSFVRLTLAGPDLAHFAACGRDQRIKLLLPLPGVGFASVPRGLGYFERRRALPAHLACPMRTYTVRAWRPAACELDVVVVLHEPQGPAAAWASRVRVGDPAVVVGPDARVAAGAVGAEFRPGGARDFLVAGDETALPAAHAILEQLPPGARGTVLLEVPHPADAIPVRAPAGVHVRYLVRGATTSTDTEFHPPAPHGAPLTQAVQDWALGLQALQQQALQQQALPNQVPPNRALPNQAPPNQALLGQAPRGWSPDLTVFQGRALPADPPGAMSPTGLAAGRPDAGVASAECIVGPAEVSPGRWPSATPGTASGTTPGTGPGAPADTPHAAAAAGRALGSGTSTGASAAASARASAAQEKLWDVPAAPADAGVYVWLAGEAGMIRTLRRYLVDQVGMARDQVAFMGYWRAGRPEG